MISEGLIREWTAFAMHELADLYGKRNRAAGDNSFLGPYRQSGLTYGEDMNRLNDGLAANDPHAQEVYAMFVAWRLTQ